jgi:sulfite exporter TauE/SafE
MTLFGLGTVPMMMSISWLKHILKINIRNNIRMAMPVLTFMFAVLFIVRGLNLGIPYLSPQFDSNKPAHVNCCHK